MFLEQYWGGPTTYCDQRGHPRLRMRHQPFTVTPAQRDRWLHHMRAAVDTLDLPPAQRPAAVGLPRARRPLHGQLAAGLSEDSPPARPTGPFARARAPDRRAAATPQPARSGGGRAAVLPLT